MSEEPTRKTWSQSLRDETIERYGRDGIAFRREMLGEWIPRDRQCEHKGIHHQCPNAARFAIIVGDSDKKGYICDQCLAPVTMAQKPGTWIVLERI